MPTPPKGVRVWCGASLRLDSMTRWLCFTLWLERNSPSGTLLLGPLLSLRKGYSSSLSAISCAQYQQLNQLPILSGLIYISNLYYSWIWQDVEVSLVTGSSQIYSVLWNIYQSKPWGIHDLSQELIHMISLRSQPNVSWLSFRQDKFAR